jgi:magnesium-transporting ATPase (P-type)
MERKLIKALAYSFILALMFAVIYYPDTIKRMDGAGSYSIRELSVREYLFIILRFAIKIALCTLVVAWIWLLTRKPETEGVRITNGFIKSFLFSFILFIAVFVIVMLISHLS